MAMNPPNTGPGIQLPPKTEDDDDDNDNDNKDRPKGSIYLSDVVGSKPQIQIFAGFTRDITSVSNRLDSALQNTTVLAPLNRAITSLPRKPWEDPRDYGALGVHAYSGEEGEDRAQRNLRRFTEAHVVPVSPWAEGEKIKSVLGSEVWWVKKEGKMLIMPGEVEVEGVVSRVANGEVWVLKSALNYA